MIIENILTEPLLKNLKKPESVKLSIRTPAYPKNAMTLNRIYVNWDEIITKEVLESWNLTPERIVELWETDGATGGYSDDYGTYKKGDFYKVKDESIAKSNCSAIQWDFGNYCISRIMPYVLIKEEEGYSLTDEFNDDITMYADLPLQLLEYHLPDGAVNPGNYIEFNDQGDYSILDTNDFLKLWESNIVKN